MIFSFFNYFLSFFFKFKPKKNDNQINREFYDLSCKYLNEYIDLKKIINRLQDIDKLKNILFNDQQRYFFDLIPKPEIFSKKNDFMKKKYSFAIKNILKTKMKSITTNNLLLANYEQLKISPSQINERILNYLDDRVKEKLNILNEIGSKIFYIFLNFFRIPNEKGCFSK